MKKVIFTIPLLLVFSLGAYSQQVDSIEANNFDGTQQLRHGSVIVNRDLRKFAGTWVYENNGTEIILELRSSIVRNKPFPYAVELLTGGYKVTKEGRIGTNKLKMEVLRAIKDKENRNKITILISDERFKSTPIEAVLVDYNTLLISESNYKAEHVGKDSRYDYLKNITFKRK